MCSLIKGCTAPWSRGYEGHADRRPGVTLESGWPIGKVWGAQGSMLPAWPGSQSGVNIVASGLRLGPPNGGQVGPVVRRLQGVFMEVDHPAGRSRERRVRLGQVSPAPFIGQALGSRQP